MYRLVAFVALCLVVAPAFAVEIIAHRGASYDAPENTLASINLAWKQHADGVEIDIYLTADGKIVVIHDRTTKRTGGGLDKPVVEQTLEELRRLDAGSWKAPRFAGERIPTLAEVLQTIPDGKRLFIEIKTGPEILPELKRVLEEAGKSPTQTPIIGFSYETLRDAKRLLPKHKFYWTASLKRDKATGRPNLTETELIEKSKQANLDGLDLRDSDLLTARFVADLKAAGLPIIVWTINDVDKAREYLELGVEGIETDRPELLRAGLEGLRSSGD